ncbi:bifunctional DNA primase/polymerase [Actinomadura sp. 9N215]|uniref:bifunctional DNA primase/polymerase n=1 Tax=Actinomadura sp. 9N215 TaxID=3375150 RepID=UPI0037880915
MGAAAQWYATQGVPVLPLHWPIPVGTGYRCSCGTRECSSPAKHPIGNLTPHGLDDATTDPDRINQWWTAHPHANIGLRTGIVFDALDLDGPAGFAAYKQLCDALGGDVHALAIVQTGRADGGRQHYLQPPGARNFTGGRAGIPPGIDCRGTGGYVVAVPSQHITGARYQWVTRWGDTSGGRVSWNDAHAWLTARRATGDTHNPPAPPVPAGPGEMSSYALRALTGECDAVRHTPEGARNDQLNDSAFAIGQLVAHGLIDEATARGALTDAARAAGLPAGETARTIQSGFAGGAEKPRQALPAASTSTSSAAPRRADHDQTASLDAPGPAVDVDQVAPVDAPADAPPDAPSTSLDAAQDEPAHNQQTAHAGTPWTSLDAHAPPDAPPAQDNATPGAEPPNVDLDAIALAHEIRQLRIRRRARRHLDAEEAAKDFPWPAHLPTLADDLAQPDIETPYIIDEIMPAGSNVLLTAQYKTGKTTLVNDCARALAEQTPFLDRFDVTDHPGRVVIFNYEMDVNQYRRWWRDIGCAAPDRITLVHLRGIRLNLLAPITQEWIYSTLLDMKCETWIVDPFARAFTGCGDENNNSDVAAALDILDDIKKQAGVANLILATHTGRAEVEEGRERARGATRLDDWADVRWILTRDETNLRFLRATGRDVEFDETRLLLDADTRRLKCTGGDRKTERRRRFETELRDFISANPGCSARDIHEAIPGDNTKISTTRKRLIEEGFIQIKRDEKTSTQQHFITVRGASRPDTND